MTTQQTSSSNIAINDIIYYLNETFYLLDYQFNDDYCDIFFEELIDLMKEKNIQNYKECAIHFIRECPKNLDYNECADYKILMSFLKYLKIDGITDEDIKKLKKKINNRIFIKSINIEENITLKSIEEMMSEYSITNNYEGFKIIIEEITKLFSKNGINNYQINILRYIKLYSLDLENKNDFEINDFITQLDSLICDRITKKDINGLKKKIKIKLLLSNLIQNNNELEIDIEDKRLKLIS